MQASINKARTIPASFYTCAQHFKEEVKQVFYKNWLHVGRINQVQNVGDYFAGKMVYQPYMVTRSARGMQAFDNVCRHHGTILLKDTGTLEKKCITCTYHGWTYDLDGRLIKATRLKGIEDFKAKDYGLHALPTHTMGPLIFLYLGDAKNEEEKDKRLPAKLDLDFEKLKFVKSRTYNLNCNWKVFVDNYLDGGYHVAYAHKALASNLDLKSYSTKVYERHSTQSCKSTSNSGNERVGTDATYTWVYPNLMLNRYGKWLDTNTVIPIDVDKCKVVFDYYYEGDIGKEQLDQDMSESNRVQDEDEELCERVQDGMRSQFFESGRYAPGVENAMYHFHDLLLKDLDKQWPTH